MHHRTVGLVSQPVSSSCQLSWEHPASTTHAQEPINPITARYILLGRTGKQTMRDHGPVVGAKQHKVVFWVASHGH